MSKLSEKVIIDVITRSDAWKGKRDYEKVIKLLTKKLIFLTDLKKFLKGDLCLEVSISLLSDRQIKKINQQFRNKNKPTDVLSFPALDEKVISKYNLAQAIKMASIAEDYLFLGDIIISYQTLERDAKKEGKKFSDHLTHLLLHSILHLIGYDHEDEEVEEKIVDHYRHVAPRLTPSKQGKMQKIEVKILQKIGIKNPYLPK